MGRRHHVLWRHLPRSSVHCRLVLKLGIPLISIGPVWVGIFPLVEAGSSSLSSLLLETIVSKTSGVIIRIRRILRASLLLSGQKSSAPFFQGGTRKSWSRLCSGPPNGEGAGELATRWTLLHATSWGFCTMNQYVGIKRDIGLTANAELVRSCICEASRSAVSGVSSTPTSVSRRGDARLCDGGGCQVHEYKVSGDAPSTVNDGALTRTYAREESRGVEANLGASLGTKGWPTRVGYAALERSSIWTAKGVPTSE
jgi:hypothetical protein